MIAKVLSVPGILISLTLYGLISLGLWQLDRANEKRITESVVIAAQASAPILIETAQILLNKEHYDVLLAGYYDPTKQFIYDNQIVNGNAGYYVLTPFVLKSGSAILVNRGFVPWHGARDKLADITIENPKANIRVKLVKPIQRLQLDQENINSSFPMLIQSLDLASMEKLSGYQIIPMLAQLDIHASQGFFRQWQPFYGSVDKHLGYAFQWFFMAFVLFIIALRLLIRKQINNTL
ncbi:SURF1 family protein [Candidatus Thioglobus sp.]|uniref:SURF1 family protein n=1 Tax=Candidatus Thioglobus sp. TaxID=2026721 RepID=UPI003D0BA0A8